MTRPHRPMTIARALHLVAHPQPGDSPLQLRIAWRVIRTSRAAVRELISKQRSAA